MFEWIGKHVDVKGLAKEVVERAKTIEVTGVDVSPVELLLSVVLNDIEDVISAGIMEVAARDAKIEIELAVAKKALDNAESLERATED